MADLENLLAALSEENIARRVTIPHDEAREHFRRLPTNTVPDFATFCDLLGEYFAFHHSVCVSHGGRLSRIDATALAKEIIATHYRQRYRGNLVSAYMDAHLGTNGGVRGILDALADGIKAEALARYTREVFDRFVPPNQWTTQLELVRQFILRCGVDMSPRITVADAPKFARDYEELITTYVQTLRQQSAVFRRI